LILHFATSLLSNCNKETVADVFISISIGIVIVSWRNRDALGHK